MSKQQKRANKRNEETDLAPECDRFALLEMYRRAAGGTGGTASDTANDVEVDEVSVAHSDEETRRAAQRAQEDGAREDLAPKRLRAQLRETRQR
jgi:hypothetical protein